MKRKPITAAELMTQLAHDPEYQARTRKRDAELQPIWDERKRDEEEIVSEIRSVGYDIDSVYDLVNNAPHPILERKFIGPYEKAFPILLTHLRIPHERIIREGIIRALTEKDVGRKIEDALLEQLHLEKNQETKWVIANALSTVMPYHRRKKHPEIKEALNKTEQSPGGDSLKATHQEWRSAE